MSLARKRTWIWIGAALLMAGPMSALSLQYDMTGSSMEMVNVAAGGSCNPCTVPVTGSLVLNDDEAGNVVLAFMDLAHVGYEVGIPNILSVVVERPSITLASGGVAGLGSTLSSVSFGSTDIAQTGASTCTPGVLNTPCQAAGFPAFSGVFPHDSPLLGIALGAWNFDALRDLTSASILYTNESGAVETLNLVGTSSIIPEPGTALLVSGGLIGLALRRRR